MVQALGYALRSAAGTVAQGAVGGPAGSPLLRMGAGEAVSLNLTPAQVAGYARQGGNLVVSLADGREIVIAGYFEAPVGLENRLYLSANGDIAEVRLSETGSGALTPSYGGAEPWGGYSALDNLRFEAGGGLAIPAAAVDSPAGMTVFAPGLLAGFGGNSLLAAGAVAGGVAVMGGGGGGGDGGGGGGGGRSVATVDRTGTTVTLTTNSASPEALISGRGEPGDSVAVTLGGVTLGTTVTERGTWSVVFPRNGLPADGTHAAAVVVTPVAGSGLPPVALAGPRFVIDMTPPAVAATDGTQGAGHVEGLADLANGVRIAGTGEAGATIRVEVAGAVQAATVSPQGTWAVTFPPSQIAAGSYTVPVTVTATDALGNRTVVTETLAVDTLADPITIAAVTADNLVDLAEQQGGFAITGTAAAGATVTVSVGTLNQSVVAGADGRWTLSVAPGVLAPGDYDATVMVRAVDAAGNVSTATQAIRVDTQAAVALGGPVAGDDIVNAMERAAGVVLSGTTEPGSAVRVAWNGTTLPATVAAGGAWSVTFPGSSLPGGDQATTVTVTATDALGNTATVSRAVRIDLATTVSVNPGQAGGDDIIAGGEHQAGVALTGRAEAGAAVAVTLEGVTRTVTASPDGAWTAAFARTEIPQGTYATTVAVRATDLAGNVATATYGLWVDSEVSNFARTGDSLGADRVLNGAEATQGLYLAGTVEPGSSLRVTFGTGLSRVATVAADGTWSLTIPAAELPGGERTVALTMTATDATGSVATLTEQISIDTQVTGFARAGGTIGGDGVLNATEVAQGLALGGTVEAGATVAVRLANGVERSVVAGVSGQWSVTFAAADLPRGEQSVGVQMTATDRFGNTTVQQDTFRVDTVAPGLPEILGFSSNSSGLRRISTEIGGEALTFASVDPGGAPETVTARRVDNPQDNETEYRFDNTIPDGTYLVVNTGDAAGNQSSTLFIVDNTSASDVNLSRAGLGRFDFSAIDLTFAPDAQMSISEAQLRAMTAPDNRLVVKGGMDDTVTLVGGVATGQTTLIDGERYAIFTLGSAGATVLLDDDIRTVI
ncbi:MAG: Ig-like domain-containing protein [Gemmobacter sp.]